MFDRFQLFSELLNRFRLFSSVVFEFRNLRGLYIKVSGEPFWTLKPIALISRLPQHHWTPYFQSLKVHAWIPMDEAVSAKRG